jgi:hypothetical protein
LVKSGKYLKLPFGPITSPIPGPTLEIEVAAAEIAVVKSSPDIDSKVIRIKKENMYKKTKVKTEVKTVSPIISPLYFIGNTPLGYIICFICFFINRFKI